MNGFTKTLPMGVQTLILIPLFTFTVSVHFPALRVPLPHDVVVLLSARVLLAASRVDRKGVAAFLLPIDGFWCLRRCSAPPG